MSVASTFRWSLRLEPAELLRLGRAFGCSLAIHALLFGLCFLFVVGEKHHWWDRVRLPAWLQSQKMLTQLFKKNQPPPPPPLSEPPLVFVTVSPAQATTEVPKDAKFYSDKNSLAANPEADKETGIPKITGTQKDVPKTEDVPRREFLPLQPAPPPPPKPAEVAKEEQPEVKPKWAQPPGDLVMAKPETVPKKTEGEDTKPVPKKTEAETPRPRPRTIKEALARLNKDDSVPGQAMKQEGGVRRHLEISSLDAKATPFGAYDAALVQAISQRWFALLDQRDYASDGRGRVVLQFILHHDGRITDMKEAGNNVGPVLGLICQKAVLDPAPFAPWPSDMRRMAGESRAIQFTFFYY